jgi:uncharacterized protein (TIGR02270 family)
MVTSRRNFLIELYEEYLEEASFLFEQRRTLLVNPEIAWEKIGEFDDRLEAHIDGLVVGDQLALEVCTRHAAEGDFGELFAAACVFCRQGSRNLLLNVFDQLDPSDAEKTGALADALKYELPDAWVDDFLLLLTSGHPKLAPILARAFGYRRLNCGPRLLTAMRRCTAPALPELVWALGRIRYKPAIEPLLDYLKSEDEPVRSAAAIALVRMREPRAIDYCLDSAEHNTWPILPLGLGGGRRALELLTELAGKNACGDCFTALGLLGDPISVPLLISSLEQADAAPEGATALECITGADLYETVFVPDEMEEDELFESEREQLKQGKKPDRGDGRPFGSNVTRLSQKPEDWDRWWRTNQSRFTEGVRYRNGGPFSPERLSDMLAAGKTPHSIRRYCSEELVTRYGEDFGIETDMPVPRQRVAISKAAEWSRSEGGRFPDGAWYFAGNGRD